MTTPIVPDFIAELFKNEIQKIQENVVKQICDVYGLDQEEVMESIGLQEVKFEHSRLRISKKHETEYGSKNTRKSVQPEYLQHHKYNCINVNDRVLEVAIFVKHIWK